MATASPAEPTTASDHAVDASIRPASKPVPKPKPKRPLSGYNLFYRYKRDKILEATSSDPGVKRGNKNAPSSLSPGDDKGIIYAILSSPPGLEDVPGGSPVRSLPPDELAEVRIANIRRDMEGRLFPNEHTRSRAHRKSHGVGFVEMGRTMRDMWAGADRATKEAFCDLADVGRVRYRALLAEYWAAQPGGGGKKGAAGKKAKAASNAGTAAPVARKRTDVMAKAAPSSALSFVAPIVRAQAATTINASAAVVLSPRMSPALNPGHLGGDSPSLIEPIPVATKKPVAADPSTTTNALCEDDKHRRVYENLFLSPTIARAITIEDDRNAITPDDFLNPPREVATDKFQHFLSNNDSFRGSNVAQRLPPPPLFRQLQRQPPNRQRNVSSGNDGASGRRQLPDLLMSDVVGGGHLETMCLSNSMGPLSHCMVRTSVASNGVGTASLNRHEPHVSAQDFMDFIGQLDEAIDYDGLRAGASAVAPAFRPGRGEDFLSEIGPPLDLRHAYTR